MEPFKLKEFEFALVSLNGVDLDITKAARIRIRNDQYGVRVIVRSINEETWRPADEEDLKCFALAIESVRQAKTGRGIRRESLG